MVVATHVFCPWRKARYPGSGRCKFSFTDLLFFFGIWGRKSTGIFISTRNAIIQYIKQYK